MIKKLKAGLAVFSMFIAFVMISSCAKTSSNPTTSTPQTSLQITIMDASGIHSVPSPNPFVQLFKTDVDRQNKTNPATRVITGASNGVVTIDSLEAINYFFNAYSNDMTKSNATTGNTTGTLKSGIVNKLGSSIR